MIYLLFTIRSFSIIWRFCINNSKKCPKSLVATTSGPSHFDGGMKGSGVISAVGSVHCGFVILVQGIF